MATSQRVSTFDKRMPKESRHIIKDLVANELVFAIVGPVGAGTSEVAKLLAERVKLMVDHVDVTQIKASEVIAKWADSQATSVPADAALSRDRALQDIGNAMRLSDAARVAVWLISEIKKYRRKLDETHLSEVAASSTRVFILDSLKHPAEVALLRRVYEDSFCLVGVVCETDQRMGRLLSGKYLGEDLTEIRAFSAQDECSDLAHGQKVADTFHLADYFVDNTADLGLSERNPATAQSSLPEQLDRLLEMLMHRRLVRPRPYETGMFHAYGAKMRSACLSRQVGAALVDKAGNVIATGTNEVPRAGGGIYTDSVALDRTQPRLDGRCAHANGFCSNSRIAASIVSELIDAVPALREADGVELRNTIRNTSIGRLIEFSRAVHAEMDALLSAARKGVSPVGCCLLVTTFPCHYCARHIICAGIGEVQYIEPYPKSRAFDLHGDALTQHVEHSLGENIVSDPIQAVLIRPYVGVAPRLYERVFMKTRPLKNDAGTLHFGEPQWASGLLKLSYQDVETQLLDNGAPSP